MYSLVLYPVHGGGSSFTASLNGLVELLIEQGDYGICNMQAALQGVGHRLEGLEGLQLRDVQNVMFHFVLIFIFDNKFQINLIIITS
jgi:hypothetical protein